MFVEKIIKGGCALLNYLKGVSTAVLSSVFIFLLISALLDSKLSIKESFEDYYSYLIVASVVCCIGGLLAKGILKLYQVEGEGIYTKDIVAVFATLGALFGIGFDLLFGLSTFPGFLLAGLAGSFMFLLSQKIKYRLFGWSVVMIHVGLLFFDRQYLDSLNMT